MKLIIEDDEGRKTVVPLVREEVEITIGRQEGNTIRLTDRNVSRRHAKLVRRGGSVFIEDVGSYNGVKVNGDKIGGQYEIQQGDLVQIGDYDLAVQYEDEAKAAPQASAPAPAAPHPAKRERTRSDEVEAAQPPAAKRRAEPQRQEEADDEDVPQIKRHDATAIINTKELRNLKARRVTDIPAEQAPRLLVQSTEFAGREYACIRTELKIGRTEDNDISIDHRSLSRNHCKLVREEDGTWKVQDLQSSNGLKINGEAYAQSTLRFGDTLELGHVKMKFLGPGDEASADLAEKTLQTPGGEDEALVRPKSKVPVYAGAGVVVLALAGVGIFLATQKSGPAPGSEVKPITAEPAAKAPATAKPPEPEVRPATPEKPAVDPAALAAFNEGKGLLEQGKFGDAEKKLVLASDGKVDGAAELLAKARLEIAADVRLALAKQKLAVGDFSGARQETESIPKDSALAPQAATLLADITKAEEEKAKMSAAQAQAEEEKRKKAEEDRKRREAEKAAAAAAAQSKEAQALADFNTGKQLASDSQRKYKQAIGHLEKALAGDPSLHEAHMYLGLCYAYLDNIKKGAYHYEEFVHRAPKHPKAAAVRSLLRNYYQDSGEKPRYPLD